MNKLRSSPDRWSFHSAKAREKYAKNPDDKDAFDMIDYYEKFKLDTRIREQEEEWTKNNLEHDLRTSDYIAEKCKDETYAQNLYAAMCNNSFAKLDVWEILKGTEWSCSWRYAGGIIADIRGEGDYIDFYCSGIRDSHTESNGRYTVSESTVTDEIREDLLKVGWKVITEDERDDA